MTGWQIGKAKRIDLKFGHCNSRIKMEQPSPLLIEFCLEVQIWRGAAVVLTVLFQPSPISQPNYSTIKEQTCSEN